MQEEVRERSRNWLSCDMHPSDPRTWTCPSNWHCDWQGPEKGQESYDQMMHEFLGFQ